MPAVVTTMIVPMVTPATTRPQYHGRTAGMGRIGRTTTGGRWIGR